MSWMSSWRERLWRWRRWLLVLLVLVIVRVALPEVLRRVLISQASQALRARVEIGDVDLSLLRGGVALEDVAIWASPTPTAAGASNAPSAQAAAESAPTATVAADPPAAPSPSAEPSPPVAVKEPAPKTGKPLIAWKRLAVELHWLPLFRKTIQLREVVLDSLFLRRRLPPGDAAAAPQPLCRDTRYSPGAMSAGRATCAAKLGGMTTPTCTWPASIASTIA